MKRWPLDTHPIVHDDNPYVLRHTLGENVARLRKEQELNKTTFALMAGVSRPYLNAIERGQADVRLSYVQKIADALCVEPIDLLNADYDCKPRRLL